MSARVLLIDDDEISRELLASLLRAARYQVWELSSPLGATRAILTERIDAVVLDVFMPDMDGDKSAKVLRDNPRFRDLVIVLVSGCEIAQLEALAARVKANAVVSKSEARQQLVPVLARALDRGGKSTGNMPASSRR